MSTLEDKHCEGSSYDTSREYGVKDWGSWTEQNRRDLAQVMWCSMYNESSRSEERAGVGGLKRVWVGWRGERVCENRETEREASCSMVS